MKSWNLPCQLSTTDQPSTTNPNQCVANNSPAENSAKYFQLNINYNPEVESVNLQFHPNQKNSATEGHKEAVRDVDESNSNVVLVDSFGPQDILSVRSVLLHCGLETYMQDNLMQAPSASLKNDETGKQHLKKVEPLGLTNQFAANASMSKNLEKNDLYYQKNLSPKGSEHRSKVDCLLRRHRHRHKRSDEAIMSSSKTTFKTAKDRTAKNQKIQIARSTKEVDGKVLERKAKSKRRKHIATDPSKQQELVIDTKYINKTDPQIYFVLQGRKGPVQVSVTPELQAKCKPSAIKLRHMSAKQHRHRRRRVHHPSPEEKYKDIQNTTSESSRKRASAETLESSKTTLPAESKKERLSFLFIKNKILSRSSSKRDANVRIDKRSKVSATTLEKSISDVVNRKRKAKPRISPNNDEIITEGGNVKKEKDCECSEVKSTARFQQKDPKNKNRSRSAGEKTVSKQIDKESIESAQGTGDTYKLKRQSRKKHNVSPQSEVVEHRNEKQDDNAVEVTDLERKSKRSKSKHKNKEQAAEDIPSKEKRKEKKKGSVSKKTKDKEDAVSTNKQKGTKKKSNSDKKKFKTENNATSTETPLHTLQDNGNKTNAACKASVNVENANETRQAVQEIRSSHIRSNDTKNKDRDKKKTKYENREILSATGSKQKQETKTQETVKAADSEKARKNSKKQKESRGTGESHPDKNIHKEHRIREAKEGDGDGLPKREKSQKDHKSAKHSPEITSVYTVQVQKEEHVPVDTEKAHKKSKRRKEKVKEIKLTEIGEKTDVATSKFSEITSDTTVLQTKSSEVQSTSTTDQSVLQLIVGINNLQETDTGSEQLRVKKRLKSLGSPELVSDSFNSDNIKTPGEYKKLQAFVRGSFITDNIQVKNQLKGSAQITTDSFNCENVQLSDFKRSPECAVGSFANDNIQAAHVFKRATEMVSDSFNSGNIQDPSNFKRSPGFTRGSFVRDGVQTANDSTRPSKMAACSFNSERIQIQNELRTTQAFGRNSFISENIPAVSECTKPGTLTADSFNIDNLQIPTELKRFLTKDDDDKEVVKIAKEELAAILSQINPKPGLKQSTTLQYEYPNENHAAEIKNVRKEVSFSHLNVKPVAACYPESPQTPFTIYNEPDKPAVDNRSSMTTFRSLLPQSPPSSKEKKPVRSKKKCKSSDQKSVVSEAITKKEKFQYISGKRYSNNRCARNFAYSENVVERSQKASCRNGSSTLSFTVEGVEPPKMLKPSSAPQYFRRGSPFNFPKELHMTVLSIVEIKPKFQGALKEFDLNSSDDNKRVFGSDEEQKDRKCLLDKLTHHSVGTETDMFRECKECYTKTYRDNKTQTTRSRSKSSSSYDSSAARDLSSIKLTGNNITPYKHRSLSPSSDFDLQISAAATVTNEQPLNFAREQQRWQSPDREFRGANKQAENVPTDQFQANFTGKDDYCYKDELEDVQQKNLLRENAGKPPAATVARSSSPEDGELLDTRTDNLPQVLPDAKESYKAVQGRSYSKPKKRHILTEEQQYALAEGNPSPSQSKVILEHNFPKSKQPSGEWHMLIDKMAGEKSESFSEDTYSLPSAVGESEAHATDEVPDSSIMHTPPQYSAKENSAIVKQHTNTSSYEKVPQHVSTKERCDDLRTARRRSAILQGERYLQQSTSKQRSLSEGSRTAKENVQTFPKEKPTQHSVTRQRSLSENSRNTRKRMETSLKEKTSPQFSDKERTPPKDISVGKHKRVTSPHASSSEELFNDPCLAKYHQKPLLRKQDLEKLSMPDESVRTRMKKYIQYLNEKRRKQSRDNSPSSRDCSPERTSVTPPRVSTNKTSPAASSQSSRESLTPGGSTSIQYTAKMLADCISAFYAEKKASRSSRADQQSGKKRRRGSPGSTSSGISLNSSEGEKYASWVKGATEVYNLQPETCSEPIRKHSRHAFISLQNSFEQSAVDLRTVGHGEEGSSGEATPLTKITEETSSQNSMKSDPVQKTAETHNAHQLSGQQGACQVTEDVNKQCTKQLLERECMLQSETKDEIGPEEGTLEKFTGVFNSENEGSLKASYCCRDEKSEFGYDSLAELEPQKVWKVAAYPNAKQAPEKMQMNALEVDFYDKEELSSSRAGSVHDLAAAHSANTDSFRALRKSTSKDNEKANARIQKEKSQNNLNTTSATTVAKTVSNTPNRQENRPRRTAEERERSPSQTLSEDHVGDIDEKRSSCFMFKQKQRKEFSKASDTTLEKGNDGWQEYSRKKLLEKHEMSKFTCDSDICMTKKATERHEDESASDAGSMQEPEQLDRQQQKEEMRSLATMVKTNVLKELQAAHLLKNKALIRRDHEKEMTQLDDIIERNVASALKQKVYTAMPYYEFKASVFGISNSPADVPQKTHVGEGRAENSKSRQHNQRHLQIETAEIEQQPLEEQKGLKPQQSKTRRKNDDSSKLGVHKSTSLISNREIPKTHDQSPECKAHNCKMSYCVKYHQSKSDVKHKNEQERNIVMQKLMAMFSDERNFPDLESRLDKILGIQQGTSKDAAAKAPQQPIKSSGTATNVGSTNKPTAEAKSSGMSPKPTGNPYNCQNVDVAYTFTTRKAKASSEKSCAKVNPCNDSVKGNASEKALRSAKQGATKGRGLNAGKHKLNKTKTTAPPLTTPVTSRPKIKPRSSVASQNLSRMSQSGVTRGCDNSMTDDCSETCSNASKRRNTTVGSSCTSKTANDETTTNSKSTRVLMQFLDSELLENCEDQTIATSSSSKPANPVTPNASSCLYTKTFKNTRHLSTFEKRKRYGENLRRKKMLTKIVSLHAADKYSPQDCISCCSRESVQVTADNGDQERTAKKVPSELPPQRTPSAKADDRQCEPSTSKQADNFLRSFGLPEGYVVPGAEYRKVGCYVCTKLCHSGCPVGGAEDSGPTAAPSNERKIDVCPSAPAAVTPVQSDRHVKRNKPPSSTDKEKHGNVYQTFTVTADYPNITDVFRNKFRSTESSISLFSKNSLILYNISAYSPKSTMSAMSGNSVRSNVALSTKSTYFLHGNLSDGVCAATREFRHGLNYKKAIKALQMYRKNVVRKPFCSMINLRTAGKDIFSPVEQNLEGSFTVDKKLPYSSAIDIASSYEFYNSTTTIGEGTCPHVRSRKLSHRKTNLLEACQQLKRSCLHLNLSESTNDPVNKYSPEKEEKDATHEEEKEQEQTSSIQLCYDISNEHQHYPQNYATKTVTKEPLVLVQQNSQDRPEIVILASSSRYKNEEAGAPKSWLSQCCYKDIAPNEVSHTLDTVSKQRKMVTTFQRLKQCDKQHSNYALKKCYSGKRKQKRRSETATRGSCKENRSMNRTPSRQPYFCHECINGNSSDQHGTIGSFIIKQHISAENKKPTKNSDENGDVRTSSVKKLYFILNRETNRYEEQPVLRTGNRDKHRTKGLVVKKVFSPLKVHFSKKRSRELHTEAKSSCSMRKQTTTSCHKRNNTSYAIIKSSEDAHVHDSHQRQTKKCDSSECFKVFAYNNVVELDLDCPLISPIGTENGLDKVQDYDSFRKSKLFLCEPLTAISTYENENDQSYGTLSESFSGQSSDSLDPNTPVSEITESGYESYRTTKPKSLRKLFTHRETTKTELSSSRKYFDQEVYMGEHFMLNPFSTVNTFPVSADSNGRSKNMNWSTQDSDSEAPPCSSHRPRTASPAASSHSAFSDVLNDPYMYEISVNRCEDIPYSYWYMAGRKHRCSNYTKTCEKCSKGPENRRGIKKLWSRKLPVEKTAGGSGSKTDVDGMDSSTSSDPQRLTLRKLKVWQNKPHRKSKNELTSEAASSHNDSDFIWESDNKDNLQLSEKRHKEASATVRIGINEGRSSAAVTLDKDLDNAPEQSKPFWTKGLQNKSFKEKLRDITAGCSKSHCQCPQHPDTLQKQIRGCQEYAKMQFLQKKLREEHQRKKYSDFIRLPLNNLLNINTPPCMLSNMRRSSEPEPKLNVLDGNKQRRENNYYFKKRFQRISLDKVPTRDDSAPETLDLSTKSSQESAKKTSETKRSRSPSQSSKSAKDDVQVPPIKTCRNKTCGTKRALPLSSDDEQHAVLQKPPILDDEFLEESTAETLKEPSEKSFQEPSKKSPKQPSKKSLVEAPEKYRKVSIKSPKGSLERPSTAPAEMFLKEPSEKSFSDESQKMFRESLKPEKPEKSLQPGKFGNEYSKKALKEEGRFKGISKRSLTEPLLRSRRKASEKLLGESSKKSAKESFKEPFTEPSQRSLEEPSAKARKGTSTNLLGEKPPRELSEESLEQLSENSLKESLEELQSEASEETLKSHNEGSAGSSTKSVSEASREKLFKESPTKSPVESLKEHSEKSPRELSEKWPQEPLEELQKEPSGEPLRQWSETSPNNSTQTSLTASSEESFEEPAGKSPKELTEKSRRHSPEKSPHVSSKKPPKETSKTQQRDTPEKLKEMPEKSLKEPSEKRTQKKSEVAGEVSQISYKEYIELVSNEQRSSKQEYFLALRNLLEAIFENLLESPKETSGSTPGALAEKGYPKLKPPTQEEIPEALRYVLKKTLYTVPELPEESLKESPKKSVQGPEACTCKSVLDTPTDTPAKEKPIKPSKELRGQFQESVETLEERSVLEHLNASLGGSSYNSFKEPTLYESSTKSVDDIDKKIKSADISKEELQSPSESQSSFNKSSPVLAREMLEQLPESLPKEQASPSSSKKNTPQKSVSDQKFALRECTETTCKEIEEYPKDAMQPLKELLESTLRKLLLEKSKEIFAEQLSHPSLESPKESSHVSVQAELSSVEILDLKESLQMSSEGSSRVRPREAVEQVQKKQLEELTQNLAYKSAEDPCTPESCKRNKLPEDQEEEVILETGLDKSARASKDSLKQPPEFPCDCAVITREELMKSVLPRYIPERVIKGQQPSLSDDSVAPLNESEMPKKVSEASTKQLSEETLEAPVDESVQTAQHFDKQISVAEELHEPTKENQLSEASIENTSDKSVQTLENSSQEPLNFSCECPETVNSLKKLSGLSCECTEIASDTLVGSSELSCECEPSECGTSVTSSENSLEPKQQPPQTSSTLSKEGPALPISESVQTTEKVDQSINSVKKPLPPKQPSAASFKEKPKELSEESFDESVQTLVDESVQSLQKSDKPSSSMGSLSPKQSSKPTTKEASVSLSKEQLTGTPYHKTESALLSINGSAKLRSSGKIPEESSSAATGKSSVESVDVPVQESKDELSICRCFDLPQEASGALCRSTETLIKNLVNLTPESLTALREPLETTVRLLLSRNTSLLDGIPKDISRKSMEKVSALLSSGLLKGPLQKLIREQPHEKIKLLEIFLKKLVQEILSDILQQRCVEKQKQSFVEQRPNSSQEPMKSSTSEVYSLNDFSVESLAESNETSDELLKKMSKVPLDSVLKLYNKVSDGKGSQMTFKALIEELRKHKSIRRKLSSATESQLRILEILKNYVSEDNIQKTEKRDLSNSEEKENRQNRPLASKIKEDKDEEASFSDEDDNKDSYTNKKGVRSSDVEILLAQTQNKKETGKESSSTDTSTASLTASSKPKQIFHTFPVTTSKPGSSTDITEKLNALRALREKLTDKELFERLLDSYEKQEKIVHRLSIDETFFHSQLEQVRSKDSIERLLNDNEAPPTTSNITHYSEEELLCSLNLGSLSEVSELTRETSKCRKKLTSTSIEERKGSKSKLSGFKSKVTRLFKHDPNSDSMKEIVAPRYADFKKDSLDESYLEDEQTEDANVIQHTVVPSHEDNQKVKFSKGKRPFAAEKKLIGSSTSIISSRQVDPPTRMARNSSIASTDSNDVQPAELGKCFLRGFRTDHIALNGETCLEISSEQKAASSDMQPETMIDFSERDTPLEFLLALGFSIDEASNAIKDEDVKNRLFAAITEARIWINQISTVQGTLLYLIAYKAKPRTMRYFLQLVEAIINKRINNAVKLDAFLRLLEKVEDGDLTMISILGSDKFEDEENEEKIVKKQLRLLFINVYKIAENEAALKKQPLSKKSVYLLRILAAKYRAGLHPHLELIAKYIGQGLLLTEVQLEAAMIYLSRLDTADVNLAEFERYCGIKCKLQNERNEFKESADETAVGR